MRRNAGATTWKAALAGLLLFVAGDTLLFRLGPYGYFAKPDSSAGWSTLRCLYDDLMLRDEPADVVMLGDSRVGEAFAPELLQGRWPHRAIHPRTLHMPGSTPRVWAYLLDRLDPTGGRYRLVLVGLSDYDECDDFAYRSVDLGFLPPLLPVLGIGELVTDLAEAEARREAVLGALFSSYAWRRDVQDFAASPWQRLTEVRTRVGSFRGGVTYGGRDGSLAGIRVEGDHIVGLPAEATANTCAQLRWLVFDPAPAPDDRTRAYSRHWLGRIAEHASPSTEVVFLRLPTQVLPRVHPTPPPTNATRSGPALAELSTRPHVHVLDRDLFAELERPEFFYDAVHLNRRGRERFTEILGGELLRRFGPELGR